MITHKGYKLFDVMFTQKARKFIIVSVIALDDHEARRLAEEMLKAEDYENPLWAGTSPGRAAIRPFFRERTIRTRRHR
jgi:hypothetical protein